MPSSSLGEEAEFLLFDNVISWDYNKPELSPVERLTLIHRKLILVYIGYLYPISIFQTIIFPYEKSIYPATLTTLFAMREKKKPLSGAPCLTLSRAL